MPEKLADAIREHVHRRYIEPARAAGDRQVTIRVGDVHSAMSLDRRLPAVAGALDTDLFRLRSHAELIGNVGRGVNRKLTFEVERDPA